MTPEQLQVLQTILSIRGSKKNDASSATLDPVLAYFTGAYTPKQQMSTDDIYEFYAPTLSAYRRSQDSAEANAARMIEEGRNPIDVARQIKPPKSMKGGTKWEDFLMKMSNERTLVQRKIEEQSLEQDHFEKQGLPGYGKGYSGEQILNMYPQVFADMLNPGRSRAEIEQDIISSRRPAPPAAEQAVGPAVTAQRPNIASPTISGAMRLIQSLGGRFGRDAEPEEVDPNVLTEEERRRAEKAYFEKGGGGRQKLRQQFRAQQVGEGLEAQGRTPLGDALAMNALLQRLLG